MRRTRLIEAALLLSVLLLFLSPLPSPARVIYVSTTGNNSLNGLSWSTAKRFVQAALSVAISGDEIWVRAGTYKPSASDPAVGFRLKDGVRILGGFPTTNPSDLSTRNPGLYPSILSGESTASHVLWGSDLSAETIIDGVSVRLGSAMGSGEDSCGGGVYLMRSSPVFRACTFAQNGAANRGGDVFTEDGSPRFEDCTFSGGNSSVSGGGLAVASGTGKALRCIFKGYALNGGGVYNSGVFDAMDCAFDSDCESSGKASGVLNDGGSVRLVDCALLESGGQGGSVNSAGGSVCVTNTRFENTSCTGFGSAIRAAGADLQLRRCVFRSNISYAGGAIHASTCQTLIENCFFTDNRADAKAGIPESDHGSDLYVAGGSTVVRFCTFGGGDIEPIFNDGGSLSVTASVIWFTYESPAITTANSGNTTVDYSCVAGGYPGEGNISEDPRFLNLPARNARLSAGSPALDAVTLVDTPATDMDARPRVAGARADMGAYERPVAPPVGPTFVRASAAAGGDGTSWANAFAEILPALTNAAYGGCEIWVAAGTYREGMFLPSNVRLYGGFADSGNPVWADRDPSQHTTEFCGDPDNDRGALLVMHETPPGSVIDGFTFSGWSRGAYIRSCSPIVANCVFRGATESGGVELSDSSATFESCEFAGNRSTRIGGAGTRVYQGAPTFRRCIWDGNSFAAYISGQAGGGASFLSANVTLEGCTFVRNHDMGGTPDLFAKDSVINAISTSFSLSIPYLTGTAAVRIAYGTASFVNCWWWSSRMICLYSWNSSIDLRNCSLVNRRPVGPVIGVYGGQAAIRNSILWPIDTWNVTVNLESGAVADIASSCVKGGWDGPGNISSDPQVLYGMEPRLADGSPCVDAGADLEGAPPTDADGRPRVVGPHTDVGAFEWQGQSLPTVLYVKSSATGTATGKSWEDAFPSLGDALKQPLYENTDIWVAEGTYTCGVHREDTFLLRGGTRLLGGFPASGTPGLSDRNPALYRTTLSGEIGTASTGDNCYNVVTFDGISAPGALDGFTVTGGYSYVQPEGEQYPGPQNSASGPAFRSEGGSMTISDCHFTGNISPSYSQLSINDTSLAIRNCLFTSGRSKLSLIYVGGGSSAITNCTVAPDAGPTINYQGGVHTVANCVLQNAAPALTKSATTATTLTVQNSCILSGFTGPGNTPEDPLFVNSAAGDYRLSADSPCIDTGDSSAVPPDLVKDLDGKPRISGAAVEMGCYEIRGWATIGEMAASETAGVYCLEVPVAVTVEPVSKTMYVESPDRSGGLRVVLSSSQLYPAGGLVRLHGEVGINFSGELSMDKAHATYVGALDDLLRPLYVRNSQVLSPGVTGKPGVRNQGLLVTVAGKVAKTQPPYWLYLSDGSSSSSLRVQLPSYVSLPVATGVRVRGVVSCYYGTPIIWCPKLEWLTVEGQ